MSSTRDEQDRLAEFTDFRKRMNERILAEPNQVVRRFFALDTQTYQAGVLDVKTKELLGLVASMVLRCDDCISRGRGPLAMLLRLVPAGQESRPPDADAG